MAWPVTRALFSGLVDPASSAKLACEEDGWAVVWPLAFGIAAVLGMGTLPRQLALLHTALPVGADATLAAQHALIRGGLTRLTVADRLVAAPTIALAGIILSAGLDGVLGLPRDRRGRVWAVIGIGLGPMVVARVGELAITYLVDGGGGTPGEIITLPHRFTTGPRLGWLQEGSAPAWLEALDPRLNLVTLWTALLWAFGIRALDGAERFEAWHVLLPIACLGVAGVVTWALGPVIVAMIFQIG